MIDGAPVQRRKKARREPRPTFVARSVPDKEEFPEFDFPGPSAAFRGERKARESFYMRPRKEECVPRELSLEDMAYTGYWRCKSPCYHVQPEQAGEMCGKCGHKMIWEAAVAK
jgi:hypothetical protein